MRAPGSPPTCGAWRAKRTCDRYRGRSDRFHADTLLPPGITLVGKDDYAGTGYDRGHMCPSAHRTASEEANVATFVMTNMQPQLHTLNAGPWKSLETWERKLASTSGSRHRALRSQVAAATFGWRIATC